MYGSRQYGVYVRLVYRIILGEEMVKKGVKKAKIINTRIRPKMHRYQVYMPKNFWDEIVKVADKREVMLAEVYRNILDVGRKKLKIKDYEREIGEGANKMHRYQVYMPEVFWEDIKSLSEKSKGNVTPAEVFRQIMETGFKELGIKVKTNRLK